MSNEIKRKCKICKRKTRMDFYTCTCDPEAVFCNEHRYPFEHECPIDQKEKHQKQLELSNPLVKRKKVNDF